VNQALQAEVRRRTIGGSPLHERIRTLCEKAGDESDPEEIFRQLVSDGLDRLPFPGSGRTIERWRALAAAAAHDLSLAKLFEGHTDALAILAELDAGAVQSRGRWAVWAAESPRAKVTVTQQNGQEARLSGRKSWCSGAAVVDHVLLTAASETAGPVLVAVSIAQPGITICNDTWQAVGMRASQSADVVLDQALGLIVGEEHQYVRRRGFWHGGAGIAACWFGAARALGETVRQQLRKGADPHARAHLGAIAVAIHTAATLLRDAAHAIDHDPSVEARPLALRVRAGVETAATSVLSHAGRALGATPFCLNARFARHAADLPVFMRQSHAERDLAALGDAVLEREAELSNLCDGA
jgi:alkylation response protein AidB-like acyl-CoA dehydrogenase